MGGEIPGSRSLTLLFVFISLLILLIPCTNMARGSHDPMDHRPDGPLLPMDPDVWVVVEQDTYVMQVEPGNADVVPIEGSVHLDTPAGYPPDKEVIVALDIIGSIAHTQNLLFTLDRSNNVEEFIVEVPPILGALVDEDIFIRFHTSWYTHSPERTGTGGSDEARIYPVPYGSVHVQDRKKVIFDVGDNYEFEVLVENNGNCEAHITMSLEVDGNLEVSYPTLHFVVQARNVGYYPFLLKQKSGAGTSGKLTVTARSNITGLKYLSMVVIEYQTRGKALAFLWDPIVIAGLIILLVVIASGSFIVYRKMKKKGKSIISSNSR